MSDPTSLQKLRTVALQIPSGATIRNLAVNAQGSIYAIDLYNYVYHCDGSGNLLQRASTGQGGYTDDIKIDPNSGRILISLDGAVGEILQTDSFAFFVPNFDANHFRSVYYLHEPSGGGGTRRQRPYPVVQDRWNHVPLDCHSAVRLPASGIWSLSRLDGSRPRTRAGRQRAHSLKSLCRWTGLSLEPCSRRDVRLSRLRALLRVERNRYQPRPRQQSTSALEPVTI